MSSEDMDAMPGAMVSTIRQSTPEKAFTGRQSTPDKALIGRMSTHLMTTCKASEKDGVASTKMTSKK